MDLTPLVEEIERAARRIGPYVMNTPLFPSVYLAGMNSGEVRLKLESEQYTGSFKARGLCMAVSMAKELGEAIFI